MSLKKLCVKYGHRAAGDCPSCLCFICNRKHHTPMCVKNYLPDNANNRDQEKKEKKLWLPLEKSVCYPITREQQNLVHNSKVLKLKDGDVLIKSGDVKNRTHWKTEIVHQLLPGRHGTN